MKLLIKKTCTVMTELIKSISSSIEIVEIVCFFIVPELSMYISFKLWCDTCNKMLLSVLWFHCLDLAIYTDLLTLNEKLKSVQMEITNYIQDCDCYISSYSVR